jgi:hypothetical protein
MPVFFSSAYCPSCRTLHDWFARNAWVCDYGPDNCIQTAIVGMRNGEYRWQYISMNTGPSGRPLRPIPTRHISCQKGLESGVRRDCRLILVLQG